MNESETFNKSEKLIFLQIKNQMIVFPMCIIYQIIHKSHANYNI